MAWKIPRLQRTSPAASLTAAADPVPRAMTAAATPARGAQDSLLRHTDSWQNEVWAYHDSVGEFNFGVTWLANMLSRVRLRAGKIRLDSDEPEIISKGAAAELMMRLGGGPGGQAQIMKRLTVQLSVPGEGYLVGEEVNGAEQWMVRSVDEIRAQSGTYYVVDETSVNTGQNWRPVSTENVVVRVHRPHDRYYHLADSPARSARPILRELELVNRKIVADYLSRLATAGIFKIPDEISFPVREEFEEAPNPFMSEFIAIASEAIAKPGTASAVIPIPISGPAEALKEMGLIDFTLKMDEKIIEKRESVIKRLATKMDMPAEILLGMGDVNHWGAWQLEEGALKTHIAPLAELICDSLTRGYLQPRLEASGEKDFGDWVVWYDMSELALRPDRSTNATEAYDRMELSGAAYRREIGFDEDDKPKPDELQEQGLKILVRTVPNAGPAALDSLVGSKPLDPEVLAPKEPAAGPAPQEQPAEPDTGPPEPKPVKGDVSAQAAAARAKQLRLQAATQHVIRFSAGSRWDLLHPEVCTEHVYSCPYTHAISTAAPQVRPGTSGTYLCHLDAFGLLRIDGPAPYQDVGDMISTDLLPVRSNGHVRV